MAGKDGSRRRWSIGEVARTAGVTVRALYHYDEIGLLRASERTANGHRRYTARDVRRLYRIRALRGLGLPLEDVAGALAHGADDTVSLRALLAAQLHLAEAQAAELQQLTGRLRQLLRQLDEPSMPGPEQLMTTLEMMSVYETAFTREQREQLAERRAALGTEAVEAAKREWAGLVEQLLRHAEAGTPVEDAQVQALAGRWDALADAFHAPGADGERTKAAAQRVWDENSDEIARNLPWPADRMRALLDYLDRARQAR